MKKDFTSIDVFIIEAGKKRLEVLDITPNKLSVMMGLNWNFVYRIETLEDREKYAAYQLNETVKVLNRKIVDFFLCFTLKKMISRTENLVAIHYIYNIFKV